MFSDFNARITLCEPARQQSTVNGSMVDTAALVLGTVYAKIEPVNGREIKSGVEILAETDTRITLRWSPLVERLTTAHYATHKGTTFNFVNVIIPLDRRFIYILAKSGVNRG